MGCEKGCKLHKNKQLLKNCSGVIIKDTFGQEFDSPRLHQINIIRTFIQSEMGSDLLFILRTL